MPSTAGRKLLVPPTSGAARVPARAGRPPVPTMAPVCPMVSYKAATLSSTVRVRRVLPSDARSGRWTESRRRGECRPRRRRHGLNRAVALRIAACGLMGLGAALLMAALLLTMYTTGRIAKIPLNIDTTLVSEGTGAAFDPASLMGEKFVVNKDAPLALQQQVSVEAPSNADVVTLQVGSTLATDRQAAGQRTAARDGRHRHPRPQHRDGRVQRHQPRRFGAEAQEHRGGEPVRRTSRCRTRGCPTGSRSAPRRRRTRTSIRSRRRRSTPTTTAKRTSTGSPPTGSPRTSVTTPTASWTNR